MIDITKLFGGSFDKEKFYSLVSCLNGIETIQKKLAGEIHDYDNALLNLAQSLKEFISSESCSVMLEEEEHLVVASSTIKGLTGFKIPLGEESRFANAYNHGNPALTNSKISHGDMVRLKQESASFSRSTAYVPFFNPSNELFGMIVVGEKDNDGKTEFLEQSDLNRLNIVASIISPSIYMLCQREILSKDLAMKNDTLHAVIHDLKSPIFCLKKSFDKMKEQSPDLLLDFDLLFQRVTNSLDINRVSDGQLVLNKEFIQVNKMVEESISRLQKYSDYYHVEIEVQKSVEGDGFDGDVDFISRVIENLLTNAIKHSSEKNNGKGKVAIQVECTSGEIILSFADSGKGIPEEFKDMLFQKYTSLKPIRGSSGIGLCFCKVMIEAHGGRIAVEKNDPTGSIFKAIIPFVTDETAKKKKKVRLDIV